MRTITKNLLAAAATVVFAIAATATTVSSAFAQTSTGPAAAAAPDAAQHAVNAETPGLTRAQVQAEYFEARKHAALIETEVDSDVAQTKKHVVQ